MKIQKLLRMWLVSKDIEQICLAKKIGISVTYMSDILRNDQKELPNKFKKSFQSVFGFPVENVYEHIKLELENNIPEKGNESQINKPKEGKKMEGKLYDVEGLSQEKLDILQEMIDNWKGEEANKRKEERNKRASKTKSKKSKSA